MFGEHIGKRYLIKPIEIPEIKTNATAEILSNILLKTHEGIFNYTEKSMGKVIRKPSDFNQKEGLSLWYFDKNNPLKEYSNISDFVNENIPNLPQVDFSKNELVQKTQKFFKDNIPDEVQKSSVAVAIRNATDSFVSGSNEQISKISERFSNNTFAVAIKILDSVFAELSFSSLENAKKVLEKIK